MNQIPATRREMVPSDFSSSLSIPDHFSLPLILCGGIPNIHYL